MNSVGYDVGAQLVIRQHLADIPGSRWSSGLMALKGMSGHEGGLPSRQPAPLARSGVGMSMLTQTFVAPLRDHSSAREVRGDRHHGERVRAQPARDAQNLQRGLYKILRRMHATRLWLRKVLPDGCREAELEAFLPFG